MRFLILSDMFSLESWLIDEQEPKIMPAVYNFFNYLGSSQNHSFEAIIFHPTIQKTVHFTNGSKISIHRLNIPFHYLRKYFSFHKMRKIGQEYLEQEAFDVIYGLTIYSVVAGQLGKKNNIKSAGRIFGSLIWDEMQNGNWIKLQTRFYFQIQEAKHPPDILICTEDGTEFDKALAKLNPKKQVHMLLNGIDNILKNRLTQLPIADYSKTKLVNFVSIGRLTYWKRHDLAIEVIHILKNQYGWQNIKLKILGKGEELDQLKKIIDLKDLSKEVQILRPIKHDSIIDFLADQHIGLFMYDASNLGNAMWETALSGRLICTRPTGKTSEIFNKSNAIIANSPKEIATQINDLHINQYQKYCQESRKIVNQLLPSWEDRFDQEIKIIEKSL